MALADKHGEVAASIPGLAKVSGVSLSECEEALNKFLSPDPYSRTKDEEGKRIEVIDGGWSLLNHGKYRAMASREDSQNKAAIRQKRYRDKKKSDALLRKSDDSLCRSNALLCRSNAPVTQDLHIAEAEAEADTENTPPTPPRGGSVRGGAVPKKSKPKAQKKKKQEVTVEMVIDMIPKARLTPSIEESVTDWFSYKAEIKDQLQVCSWKAIVNTKVMKWKDEEFRASVDNSISSGWKGLFEPKGDVSQKRNVAYQTPKHYVN